MGGRGSWAPVAAMVVVQVALAGLNIVCKLAFDTGMSPIILITYRQLLATVVLTSLAFVFERKGKVDATRSIIFQIFLSSIFGATLNQLLYFAGLRHSSPTIACALLNMLPAVTFILAVAFRMEKVGITTAAGKAKLAGTLLCIGGSMLMTFYKGSRIRLPPTKIQWKYAEEEEATAAAASSAAAATGGHSMALGAVLVLSSCVSWSLWLIIQKNISREFNAPYTTSAIMTAMASLESGIIGASGKRDFSDWALRPNVRLAAVLYAGVVGSGLVLSLTLWVIEKASPLFVAMFNPLMLVTVAAAGYAILDEKLFVGSAIGSALIVVGLYMLVWGSGRELKKARVSNIKGRVMKDDELEEGDRETKVVSSVDEAQ